MFFLCVSVSTGIGHIWASWVWSSSTLDMFLCSDFELQAVWFMKVRLHENHSEHAETWHFPQEVWYSYDILPRFWRLDILKYFKAPLFLSWASVIKVLSRNTLQPWRWSFAIISIMWGAGCAAQGWNSHVDLRPTRQSHVVTSLNGEGMRCVQWGTPFRPPSYHLVGPSLRYSKRFGEIFVPQRVGQFFFCGQTMTMKDNWHHLCNRLS